MLRPLLLAAVPVVSVCFLTSCYYDPYGYNPGGGAYYGGYSGSVFVSTGDARWGYDPYRYCYYDYYRRCYYDPYLYGYYPVGFVPTPIYGCPHPGGWRPGHGHCPPPGHINDRWIDRYRDRVAQIQASNYAWASKVRANRQTQADHMRQNQAAWANRVTDSRQAAIEGQRARNQTIRESQQAWAERMRDNRANQAAALRAQSVPNANRNPRVYSQPNPKLAPGVAAGQGAGRQAEWAEKVRQQRAERQANQVPPPPRVQGGGQGGGQGGRGGGNRGGNDGGNNGGKQGGDKTGRLWTKG